jgi:hypothetical protein
VVFRVQYYILCINDMYPFGDRAAFTGKDRVTKREDKKVDFVLFLVHVSREMEG